MNCVSATIQEAIGDSALEAVFTISKNYHKSQIEETWPQSSVVLEETAKWRLENPAPVPENDVRKWWWGQGKRSLFKYNSLYRSSYWYMWNSCAAWGRPLGQRLGLKSRDLYFPDYLGLCLWDRKTTRISWARTSVRRGYWSWARISQKKSHVEMCKSNIVNDRWRELFLHELVRLPGGQKYITSDDRRMLIDRWESEIGHHGPHSLKLRLAPSASSNWMSYPMINLLINLYTHLSLIASSAL